MSPTQKLSGDAIQLPKSFFLGNFYFLKPFLDELLQQQHLGLVRVKNNGRDRARKLGETKFLAAWAVRHRPINTVWPSHQPGPAFHTVVHATPP